MSDALAFLSPAARAEFEAFVEELVQRGLAAHIEQSPWLTVEEAAQDD